MSADVPLADGQYSFMGVTVGDGTALCVERADGFLDRMRRNLDSDLPRGHGDLPSSHWEDARDLSLTVALLPPATDVQLDAVWQTWTGRVTQDDARLYWKRQGLVERFYRCRPIAMGNPFDGQTIRHLTCVWVASDPRAYGIVEKVQGLTPFAATTTDFDFTEDFVADFGAGVGIVGGDVTVRNDGNADAYPVIRWYGPPSSTVTNVKVENLTDGSSVEVATTIATGQTLTFDGPAWITGAPRQVLFLDPGAASRYGSWVQPRSPLTLPPGDSTLRFSATGTAGSVAVVTWFDTYL